MRKLQSSFIKTTVGVGALLAFGALASAALATTPPGTRIYNQAFATYFDIAENVTWTISSNQASVKVIGLHTGAITPNRTRRTSSNEAVYIPHTLENVGNLPTTYSLDLSNMGGDDFDISNHSLVYDKNGNGIADPGEQIVAGSITLEPGEAVNLVVTGRAPVDGRDDDLSRMTLKADITDPYPNARVLEPSPVTDTVIYEESPRPRLLKIPASACNAVLQVGDTLEIDLRMLNSERARNSVEVLTLAGEQREGLLMVDVIPSEGELVLDPAAEIFPTDGGSVYLGVDGVGGISWTRVEDWDGARRVQYIGGFIEKNRLNPGVDVQMDYTLRALAEVSVATLTRTKGYLDYEQDDVKEVQTDPQCVNTEQPKCFADATFNFAPADEVYANPVAAGVESVVYRFNPSESIAESTSLSRAVVVMSASALNIDPSIAEDSRNGAYIAARILEEKTGDMAVVRMHETGPDSGVFISSSPLLLTTQAVSKSGECHPGNPDACVLQSQKGSTLTGTVLVEGCSDTLEAYASVAPQGVLFNASTREPVAGVDIALYRVEVDGSVTLVTTITTDENGVYQLPSLEVGTYFVDVVEAPAGLIYPSRTLPNALTEWNVSDMSYGRGGYNGTKNAGTFTVGGGAIPSIDIPLDIDYGNKGMTITKTANKTEAEVGEAVDYTVTVSNPSASQIKDLIFTDELPVGFTLHRESLVVEQEVVDRENKDENGEYEKLALKITFDEAGTGSVYVKDATSGAYVYNNSAPSVEINGQTVTYDFGSLIYQGMRRSYEAYFAPFGKMTIAYTLTPGLSATRGNGINTAYVTGNKVDVPGNEDGSPNTRSPKVHHQVTVTLDPAFGDRSVLIGRVMVGSECPAPHVEAAETAELNDWTAERYAQHLAHERGLGAQEVQVRAWPLEGARIYMETGAYVVTDERGYYSMPSIEAGMHVLKLDPMTVPPGLKPSAFEFQAAGNGWTRFVRTDGELARSDFLLPADCGELEGLWEDIRMGGTSERIERNLDEAVTDFTSVRNTKRDDLNRRAQTDGDITSGHIGERRMETEANERRSAVGDLAKLLNSPEIPATADVVKTISKEMGRAGTWLWPTDGISRDGRFMVVTRAGINPTLYIDGEKISASSLGEQLVNTREKAQVLAWYGLQLDAGKHHFELKGVDPFGNERLLAEAHFSTPGQLEDMVVKPSLRAIKADGVSYTDIEVKMVDGAGIPVNGVYFATLIAEDGVWLTEDLDESRIGHQIRLEDGRGVARLGSSTYAGNVPVRVSADDGQEKEITIRFLSNDRPLMAVGLLSFEATDMGTAGVLPAGEADAEAFGRSIRFSQRQAMFLKGKIRGDALLTLSYDSERNEDNLLRNIDPNEMYPVYGDGSTRGYEGQSSSKLYVKLEKNGHSVMWGDYVTDYDTDFRLSNVDRSLTGLNIHSEFNGWELQGFFARPESTNGHHVMRGRGVRLGYETGIKSIKRGTEQVSIVVRDRNNPGFVMSEVLLQRNIDYTVNYTTGVFNFTSPVPSLDDDLNPMYIQINFEHEEENAPEYSVTGVRVEKQFDDAVRGGVALTVSNKPAQHNLVIGGYADVQPGDGVRLRGEAAMSRDDVVGTGHALMLTGEAELTDNIRAEGAIGYADENFSNQNAALTADRFEVRGSAHYDVSKDTSLNVSSNYSANSSRSDWSYTAGADVEHRFNERVTGELGGEFQRSETSRGQTNNAFVVAGVNTGVRLMDRDINLGLDVKQSVTSNSMRVGAEAETYLSEDTRGYVRYEFDNDTVRNDAVNGSKPFQDFDLDNFVTDGRFVVGVESDWLENTRVYSENRLNGISSKSSSENVIGLRGEYEVVEDFTIQYQAENVSSFDTGNTPGVDTADSTSASFSLRDERRDDLARSLGIEGRYQDDQWSASVTGAIVGRVTDEVTVFGGASLFKEQHDNAALQNKFRTRLEGGVAYRPNNNRIHLLGKYEGEYEKNGGASEYSHLVTGQVNAKLTEDLEARGRVAARLAYEDSINDAVDMELVDGRLIYGVNNRVDLEAQAGVLSLGWGDEVEYSVGTGINVALTENVAAGIGYNFIGFDSKELDAGNSFDRGVYLRFNVKFDEGLFKWLAADGIPEDDAPVGVYQPDGVVRDDKAAVR